MSAIQLAWAVLAGVVVSLSVVLGGVMQIRRQKAPPVIVEREPEFWTRCCSPGSCERCDDHRRRFAQRRNRQ